MFTGLTIERANQEKITRFVLGEGSVQTAQNIGTLNSLLRAINKEQREIETTGFSGISDIPTFLSVQVQGSSTDLDQEIVIAANDLVTKKKLFGDLDAAVNRQEPQPITLPNNLEGFIAEVNQCLKSAFLRPQQDASAIIQHHIREMTRNHTTTQNWLRQGLDELVGKNCPFCGQPLIEEASTLIDLYRAFFDDAFNRFVAEIRATLSQLSGRFSHFRCLKIPDFLQNNSPALEQYPELNQQNDFQEKIVSAKLAANALRERWNAWQLKHEDAERLLAARIREKESAVYAETSQWECPHTIQAYGELCLATIEYNSILQEVLDRIHQFKAALDRPTIAGQVSEAQRRYSELGLKRRRQLSANICERYTQLSEQKEETEGVLAHLQEQLEREQTQFLDNYFELINSIFSRLGSTPFRIAKRVSRRGNMPVIQITASFFDVPISHDKLQAFFSESDRRALALSIFWAKVDSLSLQEKQQTILILDDPVTSFDDGRIDRTIRLMNASRPVFRQVIVLSHYPRYLKSFFERAHLQTQGIRLIQLIRTEDGSQLCDASPADFVESDHHIKFRKISEFIERRHTEDISLDLRIYLETEVKSRYRKQISDNNLGNFAFKDLLDRLFELGILTAEVRGEIEEYRLSLNPDHHTWTNRSQEERIGIATDLLDFIYNRL